MRFKIDALSYDLIQGRIVANLTKNDESGHGNVVVNVLMHKHAFETEAEMKVKAKLVAKQALEEAIKALEA